MFNVINNMCAESTINICLGLPADADKDPVKLCATWIDVEINLTLVSH